MIKTRNGKEERDEEKDVKEEGRIGYEFLILRLNASRHREDLLSDIHEPRIYGPFLGEGTRSVGYAFGV